MKRIENDQQAEKLIFKLLKGNYETEEEVSEYFIMLEDYAPGSTNLILKITDLNTPPEEILRQARERNKPILL
jgi:hypothetical protein